MELGSSKRTIREMPISERPRERLARLGPESLKDAELIAVLFRTGTEKMGAVALAEQVLNSFGSLEAIARASIEEIMQRVKGVGKVKAIELKAALELGKRLIEQQKKTTEIKQIKNPGDVYQLLLTTYKHKETESFHCILLNIKNYILKIVEISRGGIDSTIATPSDVFREAVRLGAKNIIVTHNHPSGDPEPSTTDFEITKQLVEAGKLLEIEVLDHIIFGDGRYVSLKERGYL